MFGRGNGHNFTKLEAIQMPHAHAVLLYIGNRPWKKKFMNVTNLEAFTNIFLHFLSQLEFLYMIMKVFLQTMAKKVIRKTFLLQVIPDIWYIT